MRPIRISSRNVIEIVELTHLYYKKVLFLFPTGDLITHPYEISECAVSDDLRRQLTKTNLSVALGILGNWQAVRMP